MNARSLLSQRCLALLICFAAIGPVIPAAEQPKAVKALLVTGGCCHNYAEQADIIKSRLSSNAITLGFKIDWTVEHQGGRNTFSKLSLFDNPDWAKGYDVVIHNYCLPDIPDSEWVQQVLRPHFEGTPAVVIHCAVQSFRRARMNEWSSFVGVTSSQNEPGRLFDIIPVRSRHPILNGFPKPWRTPVSEDLYITTVLSNTIPLATARGVESATDNVCAWVNQYGGARVFGVTTGHDSRTFADPDYSMLLTRGLLWVTKRLEVPGPGVQKRSIQAAPSTFQVPLNTCL